jgi:hypothetical protein
MSSEDRLRNCEEAAATIIGANLGNDADATLSFIWARKGLELLNRGDLTTAAQTLEQSVTLNANHKPDRPYNLACAYARLAAVPGSFDACAAKAVENLKDSVRLATDEPIGSTISKPFFYRIIRTDKDLDTIRSFGPFQTWVASLPP